MAPVNSPPVFPLPVLVDDVRPGVARHHVRQAFVLSLVAHVVLIGTLVWFDRAPLTRVDQHITQIALVHDTRAPAAAATEPTTPVTIAATTASPLPSNGSALPAPPVAPLANAPPAPVPQVAPVLAVVAPFTGYDMAFVDTVRSEYLAALNRALQKRPPLYTEEARKRGLEGGATVVFKVDRNGHLLDAVIGQSSGDPLLDAGAIETIRRGDPYPPPPSGLPYNTLELELPVFFRLN